VSKKREKQRNDGGMYEMNDSLAVKTQQKRRKKHDARELCYSAVAVTILVMCSWMSVLIGSIPLTFQTLGVCLVGGLLGWKRATIAMLAYILLGLVGVPVFAGFTGGVAKLLSSTGGYIIGFLFAEPVIGAFSDVFVHRKGAKSVMMIGVGMLIGLFICYFFGTIWFVLLTSPENLLVGLLSGVAICVLPYVPFDIAKIVAAVFLTKRLKIFIK